MTRKLLENSGKLKAGVIKGASSVCLQLVYRASQQQDQDEKMAGCVFPMGPESFQRFTPDSLAAIEQRIAQEEARRKKQYQEVRAHPPHSRVLRGGRVASCSGRLCAGPGRRGAPPTPARPGGGKAAATHLR